MNRALSIVFLFLSGTFFSQVGPGSWQDHSSMNSCNTVAKLGSKIYASYYNGIVKFEESELSPQSMNKISGLNDIGVHLLRTNPYNNKMLVIYDNSNIDIIDINEQVKNYPSIKLKPFNGKKTINEVTFDKQYAYLACGFGIIVFDMDKLEIKETYIIGPAASQLEIFQLGIKDSLIFAATPIGMYRANRNAILNNYKNWRRDTLTIPKGPYKGIVNVEGNLLCFYTPSYADESVKDQDSVFLFSNNQWHTYQPFAQKKFTIRKVGAVYENTFSTYDVIGLQIWDFNTGQLMQYYTSFNEEISYGTKNDVCIGKDYSGNIAHWIADTYFGLYRIYNYYDAPMKVSRNGTNKRILSNIDISNGKIAVSPSYVDNAGIGNFSREGLNVCTEQHWSYIECKDADGDLIQDITSVLVDRLDSRVMWAASWYYGVVKYINNKPTAYYTPNNSAMPNTVNPSQKFEPRCTGLSMDKDGNLWFMNSDRKNNLSVIKRNGQLQNFEFNIDRGFTRKTMVDKNNYVWMLHERDGGITVFRNRNFTVAAPQPTVDYRWLNNSAGEGKLESKEVYSIAEDKDGKIWIGTGAGISVMYNPTAMFNGGNFDAQPIKIVQDGNVELLLSKEIVSAIAVDGANNKWIGTLQGGVYCFSPDGLKELHHFTKENSPLYSNTILDVKCDDSNGDVYIGSDAGLQSYRGVIVTGEEKYSDVYAYPNPVKPNYRGNVFIRGLMDNSIVKVTDESGNLVWETKSTGGQIEWSLQTLAGNRVTSGVYVVYASSSDGEMKAATKILVVN